MQVQRQYKICSPELPHRVVVAFTEETLRVMQDALPFYEALFSKYAEYSTFAHLSPTSCRPHVEEHGHHITLLSRNIRLGSLATLVHANHMARSVLDWGRGMGELDRYEIA